jgi:hypothetical protein
VHRRTVNEDSGARPFDAFLVFWAIATLILALGAELELLPLDQAASVIVQWLRILLMC